jgi:hypothetical protein
LHNKIQAKCSYIYERTNDSEEFFEIVNVFIYHAELYLRENTPFEVIQHFSTLFEGNITFVRFFWHSYLTFRLERKHNLVKGVLNELNMSKEALVSLIFYIKENFFMLDVTEREQFADLVLHFYYSKLRNKIFKFFKGKKEEFFQIDREFALLQKSVSSDFYNYTIPEGCIYYTLYEDCQKMISEKRTI